MKAWIRRIALIGLLMTLACDSASQFAFAQQDAKTLQDISATMSAGGRAEVESVKATLQELGGRKLSEGDRTNWLRLSRDAALRLGDREWLNSLSVIDDGFGLDMIYTIFLASAQLEKADLAAASKTLDRAEEFKNINIREKRRIQSLRARIAQLQGDVAAERSYIDKLIDHLPHWPESSCQGCHGPVNDSSKLASLPIANLWFGERYVELMRKQGDAEQIRKTSEAKLAASPRDDNARIHLAFALRALGKTEDAEKLFKELPWADFPGRPLVKPRMMTPYP